jgi:DNA-binding LacI/PurR family transcriptional regulator
MEQDNGKPLYEQLMGDLERQMDAGELKPGDMLPSLRQLCAHYGVSAITVRRALQELVREGRVQSQQGIGSFVTARNRPPRLALLTLGFHEQEWRHNAGIFGDLIAGCATVAWQEEALFSLAHVDPRRQTAELLSAIVDEGFYDGLLLRVQDDVSLDDLQPLLAAALPYVVIKRYLPGAPLNCVIVDDALAAYQATRHLLAHGYWRIALICPLSAVVGRDRRAGYERALCEAGLPLEPQLAPPVADWFEETGAAALRQLAALPQPPQAIFAAGDQLALGVYHGTGELGLRIPHDLAVVGYDDIPAAATLRPALTTVRTSYYDFGARATQLLLDLIAGRVAAPQRIVLEAPLVVRGSCGGHGAGGNS